MTEQNMNEQNIESVAQPPRRNHRQPREHTRIDYIRQWLNIIFMLGAVVGVIFYFLSDSNTPLSAKTIEIELGEIWRGEHLQKVMEKKSKNKNKDKK